MVSAISIACVCKWSKWQAEPRAGHRWEPGTGLGATPAEAAGPPLTLDLIVRRQEADMGEGNPPRVPVIKLHGDQVPIILEAQ